jgi:hypothetical protein
VDKWKTNEWKKGRNSAYIIQGSVLRDILGYRRN